jgi:hypothetical protein
MTPKQLLPAPSKVKDALIDAMTQAIWQTTDHAAKLVLLLPSRLNGSENITSGLGYAVYHSKSALKTAIDANYNQFYHPENRGNGIIQLLLSIVFSRGFHTIREDMDSFSESLIGRHAYCTQDMVNLILYGKAISNLHDGDIDIDGQILHGVHQKVEIGQLSLFEYYDNLRIGDKVKNPMFPIYVLCSESHYTVLFSFEERKDVFDIYYYDELANQTENIRLTLLIDQKLKEDRDLIPPIELCLQTKYGKSLLVNWNNTDPLL